MVMKQNYKILWRDLSKITGQKPVITKFKNLSQILKQEKIQAGLKVTLRKNKMYEFIDRLVISLPRIKDFEAYLIMVLIVLGIILLVLKSI